MRHVALALLVGLCGWSANLVAAPLEFNQVAADAKWLGHVDFDAMCDSVVVQKAMAKHAEKHKDSAAHMKMVEAMIGMNPKKDVHGATFYGKVIGKHEGVMILHAKMDQKKISAWAERMPGRQAAEHNGHKISSWSKEYRGKMHTMSSAWFGDEHLVLASGLEELSAALDVLDGKSPSVGEDSGLAGAVPKGTSMLLRVTGISEAELPCKDPVARQTKSFRFVVGENNGESFFRSKAEMTNTEIVGSLKEVIEGGQALARIHCNGNEQGLRLVGGLRIKPDGATLTLLWKASADDVWGQVDFHAQILEKHLAKIREHHRQHGWGGQGSKCDKCGDKCPLCEKCDKCKQGSQKDTPKKAPKSDEDEI